MQLIHTPNAEILAVDDNCPSDDFKAGTPNGNCFGDGHYRCQNCIHYRADFKRNGQDYIDFVHTYQNGITMTFTTSTNQY